MAEAQLIKMEAGAGATQQAQAVENDRQNLSAQVNSAVADIKGMAAQFMQDAQAAMMQYHAKAQPQVIVSRHPRIAKVVRQNGAMVPIYEDQNTDGVPS
jgi:hypothetical protein